MEFGELKDIDLREAWPHEAFDFTPWLAENLHQLSQVIGVDLELENTEVSVEGFSADVLARIPSDNSMVVIENQLENTDHTHLGQVLTYLAGLEAQTVIWIAREFQGPHLSAIRWLNTHTVDPFAFFAVKVRAVRIGDAPAPVAPLFEVLERPNDWDRQVKEMAEVSNGDGPQSRHRVFRHDFWRLYAERYPDDTQLRPNHVDSNVYHKIEGINVSQYLAQRRVGIYMRHNVENAALLEYCVAVLESEGVVMRHNPRNDHIGTTLSIDTQNRDNWSEMADWLHKRLAQFRRIITEYGSEADDAETTPDE